MYEVTPCPSGSAFRKADISVSIDLAAMRSLYAAVQLLISRLLDNVVSTQKASKAESDSSAASMSRDRASGRIPVPALNNHALS